MRITMFILITALLLILTVNKITGSIYAVIALTFQYFAER